MSEDDAYTAIGRELGMFLRRGVRLHDRRSDPTGLDRAAYLLLSRIVNGGPARPSTLAHDMAVDLSVVSRQVSALEAAGLVGRTADPADRRASVIAATDRGVTVFTQKRAQFNALLRTLLADWAPEERAQFAGMLGRFNAAITAHDEGK